MATCWKCSARTRAASPFCGDCGAEVAARISVESPTTDQERRLRPWTALAALTLIVAGFLVLSGASEQGLDSAQAPEVDSSEPVTLSEQSSARFETLGRATDTTAIVLTVDGLTAIDLDTNQRMSYPLDGEIEPSTVAVGRHLLLQGQSLLVPSGRATWSIDLGTGTTTDLGNGDRVAPATAEGNAWIWTEQAATWREIDTTGQVIRTIKWPDAGLYWDHGAGTPELSSAPGGGIYRLTEDGDWRFIADGVPLAGNNTTALLHSCSSIHSCDSRILDLETGSEIDRWLPPSLESPASRQFRLSPSGDSILEMNPTNRSWEAVFAYNNEIVRGTSCMQGWQSATWSPDETMVACVTHRGVSVTDIAYGSAAVFEDITGEPLAVVLVSSDIVRGGAEIRGGPPRPSVTLAPAPLP